MPFDVARTAKILRGLEKNLCRDDAYSESSAVVVYIQWLSYFCTKIVFSNNRHLIDALWVILYPYHLYHSHSNYFNPISGRLLATPISGRGSIKTPPLRSRLLIGRFLKFKRHSIRVNMIYISKRRNCKNSWKGVIGGKNHEFQVLFWSRITGKFVNRFWSNKWQSIGNGQVIHICSLLWKIQKW